MNDCLFCKIIRGEIPSMKVYEDADTFAFLDIQPVNPGHTLVVPKEHYANYAETPDEVCRRLFPVVKRIANAAVEATGAHGFNIGINTGPAAGQIVMHMHVHVMPRFEGDGLKHWPKKPMTDEQMKEAAAAISELLK